MRSNCLKCSAIFHHNVKNSGEKYDTWSRCKGAIYMTTYYNMSIERIVYINGSAHNQLELVDVDPDDIKIGFVDFSQTLLGIEY